MGRRKLSSGTGTDATAFETENFAPGSNTLILLFVTSATPVFPGGVAGTPTVTGNGLAWVRAQSVLYGANGDRRLTCFRASGAAPSDGAAVIDFGSETQDFCAWSVFEYSDVDVSGAQGEAAIAQVFAVTATGQSLDRIPGAVGRPEPQLRRRRHRHRIGARGCHRCVARRRLHGNRRARRHTGFPGQGRHVADRGRCGVEYGDRLDVEHRPVRRGPRSGGQGRSAGRHGRDHSGPGRRRRARSTVSNRCCSFTLEKFFPSDAKRYIEHAALWTAQDPDDDRNGWGGKPGDPFPRNPTVAGNGSGGCSQRARRLPLRRGTRRRKRSQVLRTRWLERPEPDARTRRNGPKLQSLQRSERDCEGLHDHPGVREKQILVSRGSDPRRAARTIGRDTPGVDLSKLSSADYATRPWCATSCSSRRTINRSEAADVRTSRPAKCRLMQGTGNAWRFWPGHRRRFCPEIPGPHRLSSQRARLSAVPIRRRQRHRDDRRGIDRRCT